MKNNVVEVTMENYDLFYKMYTEEAHVVFGVKAEELDLPNYVTVYHFLGNVFNEYYNLTDDRGLQDDLDCLAVVSREYLELGEDRKRFDEVVDKATKAQAEVNRELENQQNEEKLRRYLAGEDVDLGDE